MLKCNESLAHQLLFAPDAIAYKLQHSGHFIPVSLLGTLVLMISVIALANAKIQLQIAWAVSYVILNIGHWMAAALPRCTYISLLIPMIGITPFILARDVRTAMCQSISWTHRCCSHIIILLCRMHSQSSKVFHQCECPLESTGGSTTTLTSGVSMGSRTLQCQYLMIAFNLAARPTRTVLKVVRNHILILKSCFSPTLTDSTSLVLRLLRIRN